MSGAAIGIGVVFGILFLIFLVVLSMSVIVVHQAEGVVIERLGRFSKILDSGINFIVPIIDSPRIFTWRVTQIDQNGRITDRTTTNARIDLRESVFNFLEQEVYTKDTVLLNVNALMYYRITDIKKAIYEVDDLQGALSNTAQTQLKEVFGNMNFSEALVSQEKINSHLVASFAPLFSQWGIHVERMELLELSPHRETRENMKKQMVAERQRRGQYIESEGKKVANVLESEGDKIVSVNIGIATSEATRKRSEGQSGAKVELARAEAVALETVQAVIHAEGASQSQYMLARKYMTFLSRTRRADGKAIYLPYKSSGLVGQLGDIKSVYGSENKRFIKKTSKKGSRGSGIGKLRKKGSKSVKRSKLAAAAAATATTAAADVGDMEEEAVLARPSAPADEFADLN